MSIIKKFFGIKDKTIMPIKMEDVRVGQIYEFHNGYHTKNKYYAEVIKVDFHGNYFITSIPDYHQTIISRTNNFEYHRKRMVLVGNKSLFGHLLLNQKNLVTHTRP